MNDVINKFFEHCKAWLEKPATEEELKVTSECDWCGADMKRIAKAYIGWVYKCTACHHEKAGK